MASSAEERTFVTMWLIVRSGSTGATGAAGAKKLTGSLQSYAARRCWPGIEAFRPRGDA